MNSDPAFRAACALIQSFESCRLSPHLDTVASGPNRAIYDIGWGSLTMPDGSSVTVTSGMISQTQADQMLADHVAAVLASVRAMVHAQVTDHQLAALTSLAYNVGTSALRGSTLLRDLNMGRLEDAAVGFMSFVYAGRPPHFIQGLFNRRQEEKALFQLDVPGPTVARPAAATASSSPSTADDLNAAELRRIKGT